MRDHVRFSINGREQRVTGAAVFQTLADWLRNQGATGTKVVCAEGDCGACSVLVRRGSDDFKAVNSCIQALAQLDGCSIVTVEGIADGSSLHPAQQSMVDHYGSQCGYCTPGFVVAMAALTESGEPLDEQAVRDGLTGNLCRCTGYEPIVKAALATNESRRPRLRDRYPAISDDGDSVFIEADGRTFFAPATLEEAIRFKREHAPVTIVQGGTDVGVWVNKRNFAAPALMSLARISELNGIRKQDGDRTPDIGGASSSELRPPTSGLHFVVGANASLSEFEQAIRGDLPELYSILKIFGSPQIKNAGTLAGNIANGSPIADTLPYLFVAGAELELAGGNGTRRVAVERFYRGYKTFDLQADEIITRVFVPVVTTAADRVLRLYKVSRRTDLDISAFTAAILLRMDGERIAGARIAYGGVAPVVMRMPKLEAFLTGKPIGLETFEAAGVIAQGEVSPISDVRGSREYRLELCESILRKFYFDAFGAGQAFQPVVERGSAGKPVPHGRVPHESVPHDSAREHVTGEAVYVDDVAPVRHEVLVDFLWSPVAHGRIRSLDLEPARTIPGVAGLFTHRDLAHNRFGPSPLKDELLIAEDEVSFIGQPVVVIAAENREAIRAAKAAIKLDVEPLPPVFTIDDARARRDFIGPTRRIVRGDVASAFARAEHVLEGVFKTGGVDQFYLESQAAIVYPGESDALSIHSSTQNPSEVQEVVAHLLGLPDNKVTVVTKRLGGGFGGKECQATHPAAMAALVANKLKRPARIAYSKDDDMQVTGGRHPFQNDYKVAFTGEGLITAMKVDLYSDGGAFADLSLAVMARAMTHAENAYFIPNVEITGTVCRTNLPPNTAFRGFGGPQGVSTMENMIDEIAMFLHRDPLEIRMLNCYGIDDRNTTPYGQIVMNNQLPRLMHEIGERSDFKRRAAAIAEFNAKSKTHLRGIGCSAVKFGISFNTKFLNQANALVNIYLDGTVQVSTGATEMGQGVNTKIKQVAADELGIDPSLVIVMPTSTEKNNNTSATAASSGADMNGSAAADACRKIRARLGEVAAKELAARTNDLQASPSTISIENGVAFDRRRPQHRIEWRDLVRAAYLQRVSLGERGFYATQGLDWNPETSTGSPFLYFTNGCAVSEVLIDRFTGSAKVLRSDLLMDIGKSINPGIDRGQITGAFFQGLGWLTNEEKRYAPTGQLLTHSPTTYKIPNIQDLPQVFNVDWIENDTNSVNIRSSKAVGEPPLLLAISVYCAIKNALSFVSGDEIAKIDAPCTGEEILKRLTHYARKRREAAVPA